MNKLITFLVIATFLFGCSEKQYKECNCCETTYTQIDKATSCIDNNPSEASFDNRLFLFAFTNSNKRSWNVIEDAEIVSVAKRNYLLIVLSLEELNEYNSVPPELKTVVNKHKGEELFFVVTNQALYPFRDWDSFEERKRIINELGLGNGP